jgi:hypothetical protein
MKKTWTRFTFVRNACGETERLTKHSKGKVTENYLIYARERTLGFHECCESGKLSSLRRADEEKWFINKQKEKLMLVANDQVRKLKDLIRSTKKKSTWNQNDHAKNREVKISLSLAIACLLYWCSVFS